MIQVGWLETKQQVPHSIRQYWGTRDELAVLDGVIYRGMRILMPPSMRLAKLAVIHGKHLGIVSVSKQREKRFTGLEWVLRLKKRSRIVPSAMTMLQRNRKSH